MKCRHCYISLKNIYGNFGCTQCKSHYIHFKNFQKLMKEHRFLQFNQDSQNRKMISQYNCDFCNQRMSSHIMESSIQIESCHTCQQIWLDADELRKLQLSLKDHLTSPRKINLQSSSNVMPMFKSAQETDLLHFYPSGWQHPTVGKFKAHATKSVFLSFVFIYESIITVIKSLVDRYPLIIIALLIVLFLIGRHYWHTIPFQNLEP